MNFATANNTFRQLMGNGLSYRVPVFQRDYSWSADEWDDLWQDIVALFEADAESAHYMGYLVLQSTDNRAFEIIDGQQRIATLSVIVLAALARLRKIAASDDSAHPDNRRAEQLRNSYIGYLDPVSLVPRSKLTLNRHNDRYYQHYLVPLGSLPNQGLNASEKLLRQAFVWFEEKLASHLEEGGEAVAEFVDRMVDRLFFTVITVADELNAFSVFETLNARGVRLSTTDLLKNRLFSIVAGGGGHESEIQALESCWEGVIDLLGSESFPRYLRTFWNSRHPLVRETALFKTIRDSVQDRGQAFALIRDLDKEARTYAALQNPRDSDWNVRERDALELLRMIRVRQPLAVLIAAFRRFGSDDRAGFTRFLEAVAALSFRYNLICARQPNVQEALYNRIACDIEAGTINQPRQAINALRPLYPENAEFRAVFADAALKVRRHASVVRHILLCIEQKVSGRRFDAESATYNIEHVLPLHTEPSWPDFDERTHEDCVNRLGNLTLLATAANRDIGNASYADKRTAYRKSEFAITRRIAEEYDAWTPDKIRSHQHWMARQASDIWRIPFDSPVGR